MVLRILHHGRKASLLRMRSRQPWVFLLHAPLSLLLAVAAAAQQPAGALQGTVLDESGAFVQGAKVKVLQGQTVVRELFTDDSGNFSVSGLAPGEYSVEVSQKGFADFESSKTPVVAGHTASLSITLRVKAETEQVTVVSESASGVSVAPSENAGAVTLCGADL